MREKFDATVRQHKRNLDAAFSETIQKEVARRMETILQPHWHKKIREAEDVVRSRRGIMSRVDFRKVLAALHPDFSGDKSEAFQIMNDLELVLCSEKEAPTQSTGLPRTVQEMMAMRKGRKRI